MADLRSWFGPNGQSTIDVQPRKLKKLIFALEPAKTYSCIIERKPSWLFIKISLMTRFILGSLSSRCSHSTPESVQQVGRGWNQSWMPVIYSPEISWYASVVACWSTLACFQLLVVLHKCCINYNIILAIPTVPHRRKMEWNWKSWICLYISQLLLYLIWEYTWLVIIMFFKMCLFIFLSLVTASLALSDGVFVRFKYCQRLQS